MTTEKNENPDGTQTKIKETHRFCERGHVSLLECTTFHVASQEGHQRLYMYINRYSLITLQRSCSCMLL